MGVGDPGDGVVFLPADGQTSQLGGRGGVAEALDDRGDVVVEIADRPAVGVFGCGDGVVAGTREVSPAVSGGWMAVRFLGAGGGRRVLPRRCPAFGGSSPCLQGPTCTRRGYCTPTR